MTAISSPAPRPSNNLLITSVEEHVRLIAQEISALALPFSNWAHQIAEYAHDRSLTDWHTALSRLNALPRTIPLLTLTPDQIENGVCDLPGSYWLIPRGTLQELETRVKDYAAKMLATSGKANSLKFKYFSPEAREEHGNTRVEEDVWGWISHEMLPQSYNATALEQIQMIKDLDPTFEMPSLRQAAEVGFLHNVATGESVFPQRMIENQMHDTYIRVKEISRKCHLVIGGSVLSGMNIYPLSTENNALGAMAFRTF